MDVEALYPSIDVDFAVEKCIELLKDSDIIFEKVNTDELGLYITLLATEEEREKEGKSKFCPSRIRKGKKPTITGCGSYTERGRRWLFHYKATTAMVRKIIFYTVGLVLNVTLKNHMCRFNNKIFNQMKGGSHWRWNSG